MWLISSVCLFVGLLFNKLEWRPAALVTDTWHLPKARHLKKTAKIHALVIWCYASTDSSDCFTLHFLQCIWAALRQNPKPFPCKGHNTSPTPTILSLGYPFMSLLFSRRMSSECTNWSLAVLWVSVRNWGHWQTVRVNMLSLKAAYPLLPLLLCHRNVWEALYLFNFPKMCFTLLRGVSIQCAHNYTANGKNN